MLTCIEHFITISVTVIIIAIILWLCSDPGESLKCSQAHHVPAG